MSLGIVTSAASTSSSQNNPIPSYNTIMQTKIANYHGNAHLQQVLQEKTNYIAQQKMRDKEAPALERDVANDFVEAVKQFHALEEHAFNIQAPPGLTYATVAMPLSSNQSIMRHCIRHPGEILQIASAFGVTSAVRGIIPLTTERLVQHNLIRRFVLNFCLQGELSEELKKVIKPLAFRLFLEDERLSKIGQLRIKLESEALKYLETRDSKDINPKFIPIIEGLETQAKHIDSKLNTHEIALAVAMRASDVISEEYIQNIVDGYDLSTLPELKGYKPLPPQTKDTRRIFMINGGVASGKSSAKKFQDELAIKEGVQPETVCPINRDAFKPMLLQSNEVDAKHKEFFASFTEDEAFLLRDAILREYQERLKANTAPHLYIDQVSPTIEMLRMSGDPEGLGLDLTIVYSPVEFSFLMANYREQETGFNAVTAGLLNSHANVSTQVVENIEKARQENKNNIRLRLIANVARGVLMPIAYVDYAKKIGQINNQDLLLKFFHKKHINRTAKTFHEIYDAKLSPADQCESCQPMVSQLTAGIALKA